jgi:hypothetical protein
MKLKTLIWPGPLCAGLLLAHTSLASAQGFERLSQTGEAVLTTCNPTHSATNARCKVTSLPGEAGYTLVASRSAPLIYNDVTIGTAYEKVWRNQADDQLYIFGNRVVMNASAWDSSGAAFNVNDLFRQTLPGKKVSIAYYPDGAIKALQLAGRTVQGLNELKEDEPERDNTWVDFRIDANAAETSGPSSASSPWLLTKTRAPDGIEINALGLRALNSDTPDILDAVDFYTSSYQPIGVPPPGDDDEG